MAQTRVCLILVTGSTFYALWGKGPIILVDDDKMVNTEIGVRSDGVYVCISEIVLWVSILVLRMGTKDCCRLSLVSKVFRRGLVDRVRVWERQKRLWVTDSERCQEVRDGRSSLSGYIS